MISGCGIPGRRGALPGPCAPEYYNWNNGTITWKAHYSQAEIPEADSTPQIAEQHELKTKKEDKPRLLFETIKLASYDQVPEATEIIPIEPIDESPSLELKPDTFLANPIDNTANPEIYPDAAIMPP
ncbi:MAG: hypothetical protein KDA78_17410, partial [Planctomycetaceae bacterium]|nr:hypothetical protein [Planctomycetaceae bacterium]